MVVIKQVKKSTFLREHENMVQLLACQNGKVMFCVFLLCTLTGVGNTQFDPESGSGGELIPDFTYS